MLRMTGDHVRLVVSGDGGSFKNEVILTAQVGSSSRLEALAKGRAKRARAAMEYFIFVSLGLEGLWYVVCGFLE